MEGRLEPEFFYSTVEALTARQQRLFDAESNAARRLSVAEADLLNAAPAAVDRWQTAYETFQLAEKALRLAAPQAFEREVTAWEVMRSADTALRLAAPTEYAAWRASLEGAVR